MKKIKEIIDELYDRPVPAKVRSSVSRELLSRAGSLGKIETRVIDLFDCGVDLYILGDLPKELWKDIGILNETDEIKRRMTIGLIGKHEFDGYEAGFIIYDAKRLGINEDIIESIFNKYI